MFIEMPKRNWLIKKIVLLNIKKRLILLYFI